MRRFWSKVDIRSSNDCWSWKAGRFDFGYGQFWFEGKTMKAHRMAWILTHGKIPDNKLVLHKCDNPPCVNPKHLWVGTYRDNTRDMIIKGRDNYIGHIGLRGESSPFSRMKEDQVKLLRKMYKNKEGSTYKLAELFNISKSTAWEIVANKNWVHI